ncbi:phosphatase PAP2 family protein [Salinarimonas ramus]|uniref:Phosphatase PAP2 family protein n=1 Tax=Salinarimonas ramus TaxID=690164 RepID=A0A917VA04_9HYPH|nr:phosphatase PAP2 family protein [Salinarimonas ramus]GGK54462.1 phosphatase PAP2 family protein [Salinarimonas ramus]
MTGWIDRARLGVGVAMKRPSLLVHAALENRAALLLLALAAGGLWGFIALADEVLEGETHAIDEAILVALRVPGDLSDPLGPGWFEEMMRDFTALGGTGVLTLITLAVVGFLLVARAPRAALAVALAIGGGILLSTLLKSGFDRPRPDLVPHGSIVYTASFPSGHSMMSATVYLTLAALLSRVLERRRLRIYLVTLAVMLTLLVGASRVYLGVHWPTDVLAGWTVGAVWALGASVIMLRLQLARTVERPAATDVD